MLIITLYSKLTLQPPQLLPHLDYRQGFEVAVLFIRYIF